MSGENPYGSHQVAAASQFSLQGPPATVPSVIHPHHRPNGYREDAPVAFTEGSRGDDMMSGVVGASHVRAQQQPFHHPASMARGHVQAGAPVWNSYYPSTPVSISSGEDGPRRAYSQDMSPQERSGHWEKPRAASYGHPLPHHHTHHTHHAHHAHHPHHPHLPEAAVFPPNHPARYNTNAQISPPFTRPHHPVEPNAAPSPPIHYPNSPRTPITTTQVLGNHASGPAPPVPPYRPPPPSHVEPPDQHVHYTGPDPNSNHNVSSAVPSPLNSSLVPRHMGGPTSPLEPPSAGLPNGSASGFSEAGQSPLYNRNGVAKSGCEVYPQARPPLRPSQNGAMGSPDAKMQDTDLVDESKPDMKQESRSRTVSASVSPTTTRMQLPSKGESASAEGSEQKEIKTEGDGPPETTTKKKGIPVFRGSDGVDYHENELVPDGIKPPPGWQVGTGKSTKGLLLPLMKDGIAVNPEWGFTAGGKARQRLPQACVNCRQKKIRCMELNDDETVCQHCHKMRIPCERHVKDEKKKSKSTDTPKGVNDHSSSTVSDPGSKMGNISPPTRTSSKKRKPSEEAGQQRAKNMRKNGSRAGSIPGESAIPSASPINPPAERHTPIMHTAPPMFPTLEDPGKTIFQPPPEEVIGVEDTRAKAIQGLRHNHFGSSQSNSSYHDASPVSYASSPTTTPISTIQLTPHYNEPMVGVNYGSGSSKNSGQSSSTPGTTTNTPHIRDATIHPPIGLDPRHSGLPEPKALKDLVAVYFDCVYSQTYAFLHRPTFEGDLDNHPPVLLFSMCAVAARFSNHMRLEDHFAQRARELIMQNYDSYTIEVVQSMVNMGLHDFGSNNGNKAWMFAGMAVRMGAAMNLNLESRKKDKEKSVIQKEVARRTYWAYYLMDRFNSYGVARPFLLQDHDCHIQLPCNQPSFIYGKYVYTEHLKAPNPYYQEHGTKYMGAMAYLVRVVSIWGDILRQIHLSGFKRAGDMTEPTQNEFDRFIDKLEEWRKKLPPGLEYSNENLAGQIKVGTTGAFVVMHVMWHTAMAYVHRYIRTVGISADYIEKKIPKTFVIESIRKAFVHADAVLQIMFHVQQRRKIATAKGEAPVQVNAPFLGQAISDACNITVIRALEVRGEPGGAREQTSRVYNGLEWLKELRKYWKPVEGMYKRLKRTCRALERSMSAPPPATSSSSQRSQNLAMTPDSNDSGLYPGQQYPLDHNDHHPMPSEEQIYHADHADPSNPSFHVPLQGNPFTQMSDFMSLQHVPSYLFQEAFSSDHNSQFALYNIAASEAGFPDLYDYEPNGLGPVTSSFQTDISLATTAGADITMPQTQHVHTPVLQTQHIHTPVLQAQSSASFMTEPSNPEPESEHDDDEHDDVHDTGARDIHALYFDPVAVQDGKLQDSSSDTSGHSRRASEAAPLSKSSTNNPMDIFNLVDNGSSKLRDKVDSEDIRSALEGPNKDIFTGKGGTAVPPDQGDGVKEMNCDNE